MSMRRSILFLTFLFALSFSVEAQEKQSVVDRFVKSFFENLTTINPKMDTNYVTKPLLPWSFTLDNSLISVGAGLHSDVVVTDYTGLGQNTAPRIHASFDNRLQRHLHKKFGFSAGYGGLSLSAGMEVGSKSPGRSALISFSLRQPTYGATVRYFKIPEYLDGTLSIDGVRDPYEFTSDYPAITRTVTGDVYYLFNGHRFDYKATQGCNIDQRRSAGSVMVLAKYLQGDLSLDKGDLFMSSFTNGLYRYTTQQLSLGGGYSYNFVPLHKDTDDFKNGKGYRNLTFNFTALPMVSVYNHIYSMSALPDGSVKKTKTDGNIVPTVTLRTGLSFSWDRYGLVGTVVYNRFGFKGMKTTVWEDNNRVKNEYDTKVDFDDLTAKISLVVRL